MFTHARRLIVCVLALALSSGLALLAPAHAVSSSAEQATTVFVQAKAKKKNSPIMKRSEYKKIKKGMTRAKVKRIVGSKGKIWECDLDGVCSVFYRTTKYRHTSVIAFKRGKVVSKNGFPGDRIDGIYDALFG